MSKYATYEECLEKLKTLSKEDLIEFIRFISHGYFEKDQFKLGLGFIKEKRKQRLNDQLFSEVQAADNKFDKAVNEYFNYYNKLFEEYGKNDKLDILLLPMEKVDKLNKLYKAMQRAREAAETKTQKWFKKTKTTKK